MSASPSPTPFTRLRVAATASAFLVQPVKADVPSGAPIAIDRRSGAVGPLSATERFPDRYTDALALLGVARLSSGAALIAVTKARKVATVRGHVAFEVLGTEVMGPAEVSGDDRRYLELLRMGSDPAVYGFGLYFSYGADLTLRTQAWAQGAQGPEERFWWNKKLAAPFVAAGQPGLVVPFIQGFVGQTEETLLEAGSERATASVALVARRQVARAGTRHWRRGVDQDGFVANFVESEQIVALEGARPSLSSFVQVRGSIPTLWSEVPNIKYKPKREIIEGSTSDNAFAKHAKDLTELYTGVVAVNLSGLNPKKSEGKLSAQYRLKVDSMRPEGFRLVSFDFHKQCGASNYHRLDNLWQEIRADCERFAWFSQDGDGAASVQTGVVRTNCIDCLDRTNVVQGMLGRKALEGALRARGLLSPVVDVHGAFPELEQRFKILWADHGDAISRQYSGTGALKSGFTRTGKRTLDGFVDDGIKSVTRYYLNNFCDGAKQDAVDLITGAFEPASQSTKPSPFKDHQASPAVPLLIALVAFIVAFSRAGTVSGDLISILAGPFSFSTPLVKGIGRAVAAQVALPLAVALGALVFVSSNGRGLVNRPRLRQDMVKPWM